MRKFIKLAVCSFCAFVIGIFASTSAFALVADCETIFNQCNFSTPLNRIRQCESCCNMAYGYDSETLAECSRMCLANSMDGCDDGSGSGGQSCAHGSCSGSTDCTTSPYYVCDSGSLCCREAQGSSVTIQTPVCNSSYHCTCKFIGGGAGDNYETWLARECDVTYGSGNGVNSNLGFPQTDCQTVSGSSFGAVLVFGNSSAYPGCSGYINQSNGTSFEVHSCATCKSGYTRYTYNYVRNNLTYGTDYVSSDYSYWPCSNSADSFNEGGDIYVCVQLCTKSYGSWASYDTSRERRTVSVPTGCSGGGYEYRCKAGYYGNMAQPTTSSSLSCTRCPQATDIYTNSACTTKAYGTTTAGSSAITDCCVAAGTYYDTTGTIDLSACCPYVQ